ncbi:MAG: hypothetical protein ACKOFI_01945, partial [Phycisphaerales bacterium]
MQGGSAVRAGETIDPAELLFLEAIERPAGERESWIASRTDVGAPACDAALRMIRALGASADRIDSALGALRNEVVRAIDGGDGS